MAAFCLRKYIQENDSIKDTSLGKKGLNFDREYIAKNIVLFSENNTEMEVMLNELFRESMKVGLT